MVFNFSKLIYLRDALAPFLKVRQGKGEIKGEEEEEGKACSGRCAIPSSNEEFIFHVKKIFSTRESCAPLLEPKTEGNGKGSFLKNDVAPPKVSHIN